MQTDPGGGSVSYSTAHGPTAPPKPPGTPGAPGGASGTAPPPYDAPVPDQPTIDEANTHAKAAYDAAHNRINQLKGNTYQQYGYLVDANGNVSVDPNNPFGLIQQMYGSQANESNAAEHAQLNRGFATSSGSDQANMDDVALGQQTYANKLGQDLTGTIQGLEAQDTQAGNDYANAQFVNQHTYTKAAVNGGDHNPYDPGGVGTGGDPAGTGGVKQGPAVVGHPTGTGPAAKRILQGIHPTVRARLLNHAKGKR